MTVNGIVEKFIIEIKENRVAILSGEGTRLDFTAGEALMLLDALKTEEARLKEMSERAAPIPIRIRSSGCSP
jgi:hypothetical protein